MNGTIDLPRERQGVYWGDAAKPGNKTGNGGTAVYNAMKKYGVELQPDIKRMPWQSGECGSDAI